MAEDSDRISQDEIERLMAQAQQSSPAAGAAARPRETGDSDAGKAAVKSSPLRAGASDDVSIPAGDVEFLLRQAEEALASVDAPRGPAAAAPTLPVRWEEFGGAPPSTDCATLELIREVELDLKIELGRAQMLLEDVLRLRKGSVVALDKLAGDPVDIYVNGRLIARGEVLVMNDNFCVRVAELVTAEAARAG